jgi:hypothetical protein
MRLKATGVARLLIAWATVAAFLIYGELWLSGLIVHQVSGAIPVAARHHRMVRFRGGRAG